MWDNGVSPVVLNKAKAIYTPHYYLYTPLPENVI